MSNITSYLLLMAGSSDLYGDSSPLTTLRVYPGLMPFLVQYFGGNIYIT